MILENAVRWAGIVVSVMVAVLPDISVMVQGAVPSQNLDVKAIRVVLQDMFVVMVVDVATLTILVWL